MVVVVVVVVVPRQWVSVCVIPAFNNIVTFTVELVLGEVSLGLPSVFGLHNPRHGSFLTIIYLQ